MPIFLSISVYPKDVRVSHTVNTHTEFFPNNTEEEEED